MTIDPLEIPCAYCRQFPIRHQSAEYLYCTECCYVQSFKKWITGGINAMAGQLMRKNVHITFIPNESWSWNDFSRKYLMSASPIYFSSFEQAVLDAWKHFMKEKPCATN